MKEYGSRIICVVVVMLCFGMSTVTDAATSTTGIKFFLENRPIEVIVEEEKEESPQLDMGDINVTHLPKTGNQSTKNSSLMGMILLIVGIKIKKESWKKR